MPLLDVVIVLLVLGFACLGVVSGFIRESASLLGLAIGLVVGGKLNQQVGVIFEPWLHGVEVSRLAAFVVLLFMSWLVTGMLGSLLRDILASAHLGCVDRVGGMLLGAFKGLFLAEVIVLILMAVPNYDLQQAVKQAWIAKGLASFAPKLLNLVPPILRYWNTG